jgi:lysophospholipase L1-like esterase
MTTSSGPPRTRTLRFFFVVLSVLSVLSGSELARTQDKGAILFVGSSIFHRWTQLTAQMAPLPVTNIAFDGAVTDDWNRLIESRVIPVRPKVIAYYCGSNDVDAGDSAVRIVARIRQFVDRVTKALPETTVVFVSVNKAPEKRDRWDIVEDINRQMQKLAERNARVQFVDVNPVLVNADGSPRTELFMNDQLHLRPPAYEEFVKILKPVLTKALQ